MVVVSQLLNMEPMEGEGKQHLTFTCPSRGLIGFRSAFATLTRGSGLMHRAFSCYGPFQGAMDQLRKGAIVSMAGAALSFSNPRSFVRGYKMWDQDGYTREPWSRGAIVSRWLHGSQFVVLLLVILGLHTSSPWLPEGNSTTWFIRHVGFASSRILHCQCKTLHAAGPLHTLVNSSEDRGWVVLGSLGNKPQLPVQREIMLRSSDL